MFRDVFSHRIVGYSISGRLKARIAADAINNAVARGGYVTGCVVHSDRGSQFRSRKCVRALEDLGLVGSMARVGAVGDNAAMESFFALLQTKPLTGGLGPPGNISGQQSSGESSAPDTANDVKPS